MGIGAGCVILWCKNTRKKGGLLAHTGFSWPSLTTYAIEQTLQSSQLQMVWLVSWVKDGQHHFDFLGVREGDLGHNALCPPHLPNISNRKLLSWSKELNSAVILQDCRIITLTSSEHFGFADTSVKDRRGFSVSHSSWSISSSNPSTFTQEGLLTQPMIESLGKEAPGWHPTSNGASHQQWGIFVER